MNINLLDAGFAIVLLLFLVRGLLRGMVNEIAGLVGIFLGFFVAGRFHDKVLPFVKGFISNPDWASIAAYAVVFVATLLVVALIAVAIRKFMSLTFTSWLDHAGGAVIGGAKGLLLCALALALLEKFQPSATFLKASVLAPHISEVTAFIRTLIPAIL